MKTKLIFSKIARTITKWSGSVWASLLAILFVIAWLLGGVLFFGFGDSYQIIANTGTTLVNFIACFLILHVKNIESAAINLKLDELIRAKQHADNCMINIEELSEAQLEQLRQRYAQLASQARKSGLLDQCNQNEVQQAHHGTSSEHS
jgi:low affinity Fe/Cu permease